MTRPGWKQKKRIQPWGWIPLDSECRAARVGQGTQVLRSARFGVARATGLEPATTGSTVRYSNQLSYAPGILTGGGAARSEHRYLRYADGVCQALRRAEALIARRRQIAVNPQAADGSAGRSPLAELADCGWQCVRLRTGGVRGSLPMVSIRGIPHARVQWPADVDVPDGLYRN